MPRADSGNAKGSVLPALATPLANTPEKPPSDSVWFDTEDQKGDLKPSGGSLCDTWNNLVVEQAIRAVPLSKKLSEELRVKRMNSVIGAMVGIGPQDELEGMLAAQLIASHSAAMDCYRRANIEGQTFEGRSEALTQANKLSRTYTTLLEALNRHRGKGQQKMTVEHVHVYEGGQAIVGTVEHRTGGQQIGNEVQPHARIPVSAQPAMRSQDTQRETMPGRRNAERPLSDARRTVTRRAKGK